MKKIANLLSLLVSLCCISFSTYGQVVSPIMHSDGIITVNEVQQAKTLKKLAVHPVAAKAIQKVEKKGEFQNVSYKLAPNVKRLTTVEKNQLSIRRDGILNVNKSNGTFIPSPDFIYLDDESDLVFQSSKVNEDEMILFRPKMHEVFESIDIPDQEVPLTLANTVELAEDIIASSVETGQDYAINLQFDNLNLTIDSTKQTKITVKLDGMITLTQPRAEVRYSKNDGYKVIFKTEERVNLKTEANVKFAKEYKKPLWGTEIPIEDIGKCDLGVFLLINVDGEISLVLEVNQGMDLALGVRGGTCWYIPTSIKNASEINSFCDVDYVAKSKIKAFAGIQCTAKLKFKSYTVLNIYANGGMEGSVEATLENGTPALSADIGFRIKAVGEVVSKKMTFTDKYYSLWKYQTPDYEGYDMVIHEACAFGNYVAGEIRKKSNLNETNPYQGDIQVLVKHPNGTQNEFSGQSDANGVFLFKNVPLSKGDKIAVRVKELGNWSSFVNATIPFKEIKLTAVDYCTGTAYGNVSSFKSDWYKLALQSGNSQNLNSSIASIFKKTGRANVVNMQKSEILQRINDLKNNTLTYQGEIKFHTQNMSETTLSAAGTKNTRQMPKSTGKQRENKGYVNNSPLGLFEIKNLEFSPNERVKAVIEIEGFTIESDWVQTDGLLVSEIITDGLQYANNLNSLKISAKNSIVLVSAIRSEVMPTGEIHFLQGADMPHSSISNAQPIKEFPEANNAVVFINKVLPLTPIPGQQGAAIAQSEAWTSTVTSNSPGIFMNPSKNGTHPFEKVSYFYKNNDLGYEYLVDECHSCKSPQNVIENIDLLQKYRIEGKLQNIGKKVNRKMPRIISSVVGGIQR
jgi:hypothetical protein